ncbi:hypothetical protein [Streptomyces phaeochromogenes]
MDQDFGLRAWLIFDVDGAIVGDFAVLSDPVLHSYLWRVSHSAPIANRATACAAAARIIDLSSRQADDHSCIGRSLLAIP